MLSKKKIDLIRKYKFEFDIEFGLYIKNKTKYFNLGIYEKV